MAPPGMLVSNQISDEHRAPSIKTAFRLLAVAGQTVRNRVCNVADVLETIQRCAEDADPKISSDRRAAFRLATGMDFDSTIAILYAAHEVDDSFQMPTSIRFRFAVFSDGSVHDMAHAPAA